MNLRQRDVVTKTCVVSQLLYTEICTQTDPPYYKDDYVWHDSLFTDVEIQTRNAEKSHQIISDAFTQTNQTITLLAKKRVKVQSASQQKKDIATQTLEATWSTCNTQFTQTEDLPMRKKSKCHSADVINSVLRGEHDLSDEEVVDSPAPYIAFRSGTVEDLNKSLSSRPTSQMQLLEDEGNDTESFCIFLEKDPEEDLQSYISEICDLQSSRGSEEENVLSDDSSENGNAVETGSDKDDMNSCKFSFIRQGSAQSSCTSGQRSSNSSNSANKNLSISVTHNESIGLKDASLESPQPLFSRPQTIHLYSNKSESFLLDSSVEDMVEEGLKSTQQIPDIRIYDENELSLSEVQGEPEIEDDLKLTSLIDTSRSDVNKPEVLPPNTSKRELLDGVPDLEDIDYWVISELNVSYGDFIKKINSFNDELVKIRIIFIWILQFKW